MGSLAGTALWRMVLNGNTVASRETVLPTQLNMRIRDVRQGPDGAIYVLTDGSGARILRIGR